MGGLRQYQRNGPRLQPDQLEWTNMNRTRLALLFYSKRAQIIGLLWLLAVGRRVPSSLWSAKTPASCGKPYPRRMFWREQSFVHSRAHGIETRYLIYHAAWRFDVSLLDVPFLDDGTARSLNVVNPAE